MKKATVVMGFALLTGCGGAPGNTIGITSYEIRESPTELDIVGRDAAQNVVGSLKLQVGRFLFANPESNEPPREVDGRRLNVTVLDRSVKHESEGYGPRRLPPLEGNDPAAPLNVFLFDPQVSTALARWQVTMRAELLRAQSIPVAAKTGEKAYSGGYCNFGFPTSCGETDCAAFNQMYDDSTCEYGEFEYVCCNTARAVFQRFCGGDDRCGAPGPNGCAPCWTVANYGSYQNCSVYSNATPNYATCWNGANAMQYDSQTYSLW
jgi:hypothetical protein